MPLNSKGWKASSSSADASTTSTAAATGAGAGAGAGAEAAALGATLTGRFSATAGAAAAFEAVETGAGAGAATGAATEAAAASLTFLAASLPAAIFALRSSFCSSVSPSHGFLRSFLTSPVAGTAPDSLTEPESEALATELAPLFFAACFSSVLAR